MTIHPSLTERMWEHPMESYRHPLPVETGLMVEAMISQPATVDGETIAVTPTIIVTDVDRIALTSLDAHSRTIQAIMCELMEPFAATLPDGMSHTERWWALGDSILTAYRTSVTDVRNMTIITMVGRRTVHMPPEPARDQRLIDQADRDIDAVAGDPIGAISTILAGWQDVLQHDGDDETASAHASMVGSWRRWLMAPGQRRPLIMATAGLKRRAVDEL